MRARLLAFVVWAVVAASAMFWILRMSGGGASAPSHAVSVSATDVPRGDWSRLFPMNAAPAASAPVVQDAAAASRFKLVGVAAPRWASIAVDGKPPRSVALGANVDGDWVVQTIATKEVAIGPRGQAAVFTLALAGLPPPATGTLPPAESTVGLSPPPNRVAPPPPPVMAPAVPPDAIAPGAVIPPPPKQPATNGVEVGSEGNVEPPPPTMPVLTR
jgi:general secretion pathway protein C